MVLITKRSVILSEAYFSGVEGPASSLVDPTRLAPFGIWESTIPFKPTHCLPEGEPKIAPDEVRFGERNPGNAGQSILSAPEGRSERARSPSSDPPHPIVIAFPWDKKPGERVRISCTPLAAIMLAIGLNLGTSAQTPPSVAKP